MAPTIGDKMNPNSKIFIGSLMPNVPDELPPP
jgi:hypothetical protein